MVLRCPDSVTPESRKLEGGEFSIGRASENDWVLSDPEVSRHHCRLAYRSCGWRVADLSANGTFLNQESEPIGSDQSRELRDGDRLRLGEHKIEVRIRETAVPNLGAAGRTDPFALDPFAASPVEACAQDPLLRRRAEQDVVASPLVPPSIKLPPDYDSLVPEPGEAPFAGSTQPDQPLHPFLPEDWDQDPNSLSGAAAPPETAELAPVGPMPPPAASVGASPVVVQRPASGPPHEDLLAAFLRGAGLRDARPADGPAVMEALGAAFRAFVCGLRQVMIARDAIKGEFRIEPTKIRARGNNPLKFSANDDDALAALLGIGRHTEMSAEEAVTEALRDVRAHELATVSAMQSAVRTILAQFDPMKLGLSAEHGGLDFVPMQKKAHAWEAFEALYTRTTRELTEDFDSSFGTVFARAYERAVAEISAREEPPQETGR